MKPYRFEKRLPGYYLVPLRSGPAVLRPNRTAAGLTATRDRSPRPGDDGLRLAVRGTHDTMQGLAFLRVHTICPCCKRKTGKLALNDSGRVRLRALRRRRSQRED